MPGTDDLAKQATPAVEALSVTLTRLGVHFEQEVILHNRATGAWCIVDFVLPQHRIVIELDGQGYRQQWAYDRGRDRWIEAETGYRVVRKWNDWAMGRGLELRLVPLLSRERDEDFENAGQRIVADWLK